MNESNIQEMRADIKDLEYTVKQNKFFILQHDYVKALEKNPAFKEIILEGFMKDYALEQIEALAIPECRSQEAQASIQRNIGAVSSLKQFLNMLLQHGANSVDELEASEKGLQAARDELDEAMASNEGEV